MAPPFNLGLMTVVSLIQATRCAYVLRTAFGRGADELVAVWQRKMTLWESEEKEEEMEREKRGKKKTYR